MTSAGVIPAKSARKVSREATSIRSVANARARARETDGTTFPHFFFPVERKNFQNHRKRRRAFGVWNRRKGKKIARSLLFSSLLFVEETFSNRRDAERLTENLDSRSSRRERKADSSETSLPLYTLSTRRIERGTPRVINYYKHTFILRTKPPSPRPVPIRETTNHD
jgi:hypothetical protein